MKAILVLTSVSCLLIVGCGEGGNGSKPATNESAGVITAPVDYLGAVSKAQQASIKTVDVAQLTQAIQMFQAEHERLPKDLNELVAMKFLKEIPKAPQGKKIIYEANTGAIKVVAQ